MSSTEETLLEVVDRAEEVLITHRGLPARVKSLERRLDFFDSLETGPRESSLETKSQGGGSGIGQITSLLGLVRGMIDRLELETNALESRIKGLEALASQLPAI